jgi:hypothetical protein
MAIVKNVRGGSLQAVKEMANEIKRSWDLDRQASLTIRINREIAASARRWWCS